MAVEKLAFHTPMHFDNEGRPRRLPQSIPPLGHHGRNSDYQIKFVGQQQQDDLHFYVFDVSPVGIQVGKPQFEGRIWVNSRDFFIVKSHGTIVIKREKKRKGHENPLPAVTTSREQIDGRYWFPSYSRANDVLHLSSGEVQIDEVIKLTNFRAIANSK